MNKDPSQACGVVDGQPWYSMTPPEGAVFVGMEKEPNSKPRYGKLCHPWFNKPCYETKQFKQETK